MTVTELAIEMENHERYPEFLEDLIDRKYPHPNDTTAATYDVNDHFEYFWRRIASGENLDRSDYID